MSYSMVDDRNLSGMIFCIGFLFPSPITANHPSRSLDSLTMESEFFDRSTVCSHNENCHFIEVQSSCFFDLTIPYPSLFTMDHRDMYIYIYVVNNTILLFSISNKLFSSTYNQFVTYDWIVIACHSPFAESILRWTSLTRISTISCLSTLYQSPQQRDLVVQFWNSRSLETSTSARR